MNRFSSSTNLPTTAKPFLRYAEGPGFPPRSRRGFTLFDPLLVVALLGVFLAVARPVLRGSIRALEAPAAAVAGGRLDAALAVLRADVWQSPAPLAPNPHELALADADGRPVTWHVGPGGGLTRSAPGTADQRWPSLFPVAATVAVDVAVDGAAVRLTIPDAPGFLGGTVVLPSQAALLARGTP